MPQLIKNIEGSICDDYNTNISLLTSIFGEIQEEDYINLNGFVAFLQNLVNTEETSALTPPQYFGVKNKNNLPILILNINY